MRVSVRGFASRLVGVSALAVDGAFWVEGVSDERLVTASVVGVGLALAFLPLIARPSWSFSPLIALSVFGVIVAVVAPSFVPFAGSSVALYRVAARKSLRGALSGLLVAGVPVGFALVHFLRTEAQPSPGVWVLSTLIWLLLLFIPWVLGRLAFLAGRRSIERERLQELAASAALQSERLRLARELHDIVSHSVSAMILQAAGARAGSGDEARMRGALEAVETTGVQAMRELHRLLGLLRSVEETESIGSAGLPQESLADLEPLLQTVRACEVEVEVQVDGTPQPLDPSIDHAAYRVLQESLANVIKHAGRRANARVHITWGLRDLLISVRSTPGLIGTEARPDLSSGLGLRGLRERIALVGGGFEAGPASDGAYIASATLPRAPGGISTAPGVASR